jgi:uncharacterized membrane protein YedE/YeeE
VPRESGHSDGSVAIWFFCARTARLRTRLGAGARTAGVARTLSEDGRMTTDFTPIASTVGGVIMGLAAALMLAGNGRIAGVSGILGGLLEGSEGRSWRGSFIVGMLVGAAGLLLAAPQSLPGSAVDSLPMLAVAGLLVGFGTRMGSGCTTGHGICGLSRLSMRSLIATLMFMGTGIATVSIIRHVFGGVG